MAVCTNCGAELAPSMKFCCECGTPVPQTKKCPSCGAELPLKTKFCPECGASQDGAAVSGISMGDKNVIAGDVIAHKEELNIAGNATIIKNEDQSKQVKQCHICGSMLLITQSIICPHCGQYICADCYDKEHNICADCAAKQQSQDTDTYKAALEKALADGRIDFTERKELLALQAKLGISAETAKTLEAAAKQALTSGTTAELTRIEKANLDKARSLFYQEARFTDALALVEPLYLAHADNEQVLEVYLPILAETDETKTLQIIGSLQADELSAYSAEVKIYLRQGKLDKAERKLQDALGIWPDSAMLQCQYIFFLYAMYMQTHDDSLLNQAKAMLNAVSSTGADPVAQSFIVKAQDIVLKGAPVGTDNAGSSPASYYTQADCQARGLYYGIMSQSVIGAKIILVGSGALCDYSDLHSALQFAEQGSEIRVEPGIYREPNTLFKTTKAAKLIGRTQSITEATPAELPIIVIDDSASCEITSPLHIEGVVFTTDAGLSFTSLSALAQAGTCTLPDLGDSIQYGGHNFASMLLVQADAELHNTAVIRSHRHGITFTKGTARLTDSIIHDCGGCGILIEESAAPVITGTTVSGTQTGINTEGAGTVSIHGCNIFKNKVFGISFSSSSDGEVEDCTLHENNDTGIALSGSTTVRISRCSVYQNAENGIGFIQSASPSVTDCRIYKNGTPGKNKPGIIITDTAKPSIHNCTINENIGNGVFIVGNAEPVLEGCSIFKNLLVGSDMSGPGVAIAGQAKPVFRNCDMYGQTEESNCLWIQDSAGGTYENCRIHDNRSTGVAILDSATPVLRGCEIYKNVGGINIGGNAVPECTDCKIYHNNINETRVCGILVHEMAQPVIRGCEVYGHMQHGILLSDNAGGSYEKCNIHDNTPENLCNESSGRPRIHKC